MHIRVIDYKPNVLVDLIKFGWEFTIHLISLEFGYPFEIHEK